VSDSRFPYTCLLAQKQMGTFVRLLSEHDLLPVPPDPGRIWNTVTLCHSCTTKPEAKRCTGWCITIDPGLLVLKTANVRGRLVSVELTATCSYERSEPEQREQWQRQPLRRSSVAALITDVASNERIERYHLDLAGGEQNGPVWHLQNPGRVPDGRRLGLDWLTVPRWAVAPADIVLAAEMVIFNFLYEDWVQLNENGEWINLVKWSEDLVLWHWVEHLRAHFERPADDRATTWLTSQDNAAASRWSPRPR
jgi:hypothetical protein